MDHNEPTIQPTATETAVASGAPRLSESRRLIASALLAIGLLTVGGVAVVSAASPAPSTSPGASAPAGGGTGTQTQSGNCPNM
jgi:hypothetical protein